MEPTVIPPVGPPALVTTPPSPNTAVPVIHHLAPSAPPRARHPQLQSLGDVTTRHPQYRIAFTVPWIGKTFPSWFPYFLSSCRRSNFIADWLIFHEGAKMPSPDEILPTSSSSISGRMASASSLAPSWRRRLVWRMRRRATCSSSRRPSASSHTSSPSTKPTHGVVFAEYLASYSHWSYTDIDMLIGDLPLFVELEELTRYDIFTYHFGDVFRLYLRGQFAAHRNTREINMLWAECPHLGDGLARELEAKHEIVRRLAAEGKHGRTRFISAEGCYSWVVASKSWMRVKFASKAFADWSDDREFYVVDGAVRKCPQPSLVWQPPPAHGYPGGHPPTSHGTCSPFGPRIAAHSTRVGRRAEARLRPARHRTASPMLTLG